MAAEDGTPCRFAVSHANLFPTGFQRMLSEQIKLICKKLAASEERVRIKGFLGAKKLLTGAEPVACDQMLLVMKGLHYMLWMQDQPIRHEDIVDMICSLLAVIPRPADKLNFIRAFFDTEAREWQSIDYWRIDKFMMLARRFLKACLAFLQSTDWNDERVSEFVLTLRSSVVNHNFNQSCNGLKIHLADIVCDELSITSAPQAAVLSLLRPFIDLVANGMHKHHVVEKVEQAVLQFLADQALYKAEAAGEETEVCLVNVNMDDLCQCLLAVGSDPSLKSPNRQRLFHWYRTFRNIVTGNVKPDGALVATGPVLGKAEITEAVGRLVKQEKRKRKKKRKNRSAAAQQQSGSDAMDDATPAAEADMSLTKSLKSPKKKKAPKSPTANQSHLARVVKRSPHGSSAKSSQDTSANHSPSAQVKSNVDPVDLNPASVPLTKQKSPAAMKRKLSTSPTVPPVSLTSPAAITQGGSVDESTPVAKRARLSMPSLSPSVGTAAVATPLQTPQSMLGDSDVSNGTGGGQLNRSVRFGKIFRKRFSKKDRVVTPSASGDDKTPERSILKKSGGPGSLKLRSPAAKRSSPSPHRHS